MGAREFELPDSEEKDVEIGSYHEPVHHVESEKHQGNGEISPIELYDATDMRSKSETPSTMLTRIASQLSTTDIHDPGPPPDGGAVAWIQALMAHLVLFNTWGYVTSYGVFQSFYVDSLGHPPSDISWVGSVQIFLLFFIGTVSGRATDAGLFKPTLLLGMFFHLLGVFMTSLAGKYWQLFLAQGICTGQS